MQNQAFIDRLIDYTTAFEGIVGQEAAKKQLASALISGRNVILSGPPGIGKTSMAKTVAKLLAATGEGEAPFIRVQGSPDLTAEDLIGDIDPIVALEKGPMSVEAFTPGKIFKADGGVLFFDEINRAPERLQNALLQVLEERVATIGSYTVDFPANFILIGTMNPKDTSTEKLSEVFLDRFDIVEMGYPDALEVEREIVLEQARGASGVEVPDHMTTMMVQFVQNIRRKSEVLFGPSVRGTIGLFERASSHAQVSGRDEVTLEDLKAVAASVLAHRIVLKPSAGFETSRFDFINQQFDIFSEEFMQTGDSLRQS